MASDGAVAHDFFDFYDGGQKIAISLARHLNWDLITADIKANVPELSDIDITNIKAYRHAPTYLKFSRIFQLKWGFENLTRDLLRHRKCVVFSGSLSLFAHINCTGKKILYCHTPPRLVYDLKSYNLSQVRNPLKNLALRLTIKLYRRAYEEAIKHMDVVLANSVNVQKRLREYLDIESGVVYPPVNMDRFCFREPGGYYLSSARLDPAKRVKMIAEAFLKMPDKKLVILSGGSQEGEIKKLIRDAPNITYLGWVEEKKLAELLSVCIATIYIPRDEDFGISPVESMAAGKPVVGVSEGGLLETVLDGETGILLPADITVEDIIKGVARVTPARAVQMKQSCIERAKHFTEERFIDSMKKYL